MAKKGPDAELQFSLDLEEEEFLLAQQSPFTTIFSVPQMQSYKGLLIVSQESGALSQKNGLVISEEVNTGQKNTRFKP